MAYQSGQSAGDIASFLGGGELLKLGLGGAKMAPALASAMPHLGMAGYGALMAPEGERISGAGWGAIGSLAGARLPSMAKALSPQNTSDEIMQLYGGKSLEESGKTLASKVKVSFENLRDKSNHLL